VCATHTHTGRFYQLQQQLTVLKICWQTNEVKLVRYKEENHKLLWNAKSAHTTLSAATPRFMKTSNSVPATEI